MILKLFAQCGRRARRRPHTQRRGLWGRTRHPSRRPESLERRALLAADLAISNQASIAGALVPGSVEQYDITVANHGATDATAAVITDQLPAGETFLRLDVPNATTSPQLNYHAATNSVTYMPGTIAAGGSASAIVYALVGAAAGPALVNTATAFTTDDPNHASSAEAVTAQQQNSVGALGAGASDLSISVSIDDSSGTMTPGGVAFYTITVKNDGARTATGIEVTDLLPAGSSPDSYAAGQPGMSGLMFPRSNIADATLDDLPAGQSISFNFSIYAPSSPPGALMNLAYVTSTGGDTDPSDNFTTTTTPVTGASGPYLQLALTDMSSAYVTLNQPFVYTLTIHNDGQDATNVFLTDVLPRGVVFLEGHGSISTLPNPDTGISVAAQSDNILSVFIAKLPLGGVATEALTVLPTATGAITNTAFVESTDGQHTSPSATNTVSTNTYVDGAGLAANYLAGTRGDGNNQPFVTNLYQELLGRVLDFPGQDYWMTYLLAAPGAAGRDQAVATFLNTDEYKQLLVTTVYQNLLHRAPDASGLKYWTATLGYPGEPEGHNGAADEKYLVALIASCDEYYADAGGTDAGWVDQLYTDLVGRAADQGGESYWVRQAAGLTANRGGVVVGILNTQEVEEKLLNGNFPDAANLSSPKTTAGGAYALANITGGGWENLYFEGPPTAQQGTDPFLAQLEGQAPWDDVIAEILESSQFYLGA